VAPSSADCFTDRVPRSQLPLHWKSISVSNRERVNALSTVDPQNDADWAYCRRFLEDESVYEDAGVSSPEVYVADLMPGDHAQMEGDGSVERVPPGCATRASTRIFTRGEHLHDPVKRRRRQINHAIDANRAITRETLTVKSHIPKSVIRAAVRRGHVGLSIDYSQYFNSFLVSEGVRDFFHYINPEDGTLWRTCRMGMGLRTSSMIACTQTARVCSIALPPSVTVHTYCDNIRVTGERAEAIAVMKQIVERSLFVGLTINEDVDTEGTMDPAKVAALVEDEYDFLGERYCHSAASMSSTAKSMNKLAATFARRATWTYREWAAFQGILLFVSSTQRIPIFEFQRAMRFMRSAAVALEKDPSLWEAAVPALSPAVLEEYTRWHDRAARNVPVPIAAPPGVADYVIMSDASRWGFSCITWNVAAGTVSVVQEEWLDTLPDASAARSAHAEPEGIFRALCRTVPAAVPARVIFYTDHGGFVFAGNAGHGKSDFYNDTLSRIYRGMPLLTLELRHVPGVKNLVDAWSRGAPISDGEEEQVLAALRAYTECVTLTDAVDAPFARPLMEGGVASLVVAAGAAASGASPH
jgi:hypothetical protein